MSEEVVEQSVLEETKAEEVLAEAEVGTQAEGAQAVNLNEMKIAYVVGLAPNGDFVFDVYGTEKGLVELLGIHQHATKRVDRIYQDSQAMGDRITMEVGRAVAGIHQKIDQLLSVVAPRKPDNKL